MTGFVWQALEIGMLERVDFSRVLSDVLETMTRLL
jgi:hypothetical protein